ncbi:hypothetical protein D9M69_665170 [compost metagenome]
MEDHIHADGSTQFAYALCDGAIADDAKHSVTQIANREVEVDIFRFLGNAMNLLHQTVVAGHPAEQLEHHGNGVLGHRTGRVTRDIGDLDAMRAAIV